MFLNKSSVSRPPGTQAGGALCRADVGLSYDLDKARQTVATAYSVKAATDTENAALFSRVTSLEEERESMTQKMMKVLSENRELHEAMPKISRPTPPEASKMADSPPTFFNMGGNAEEEEPGWDDQVYEEEEWC